MENYKTNNVSSGSTRTIFNENNKSYKSVNEKRKDAFTEHVVECLDVSPEKKSRIRIKFQSPSKNNSNESLRNLSWSENTPLDNYLPPKENIVTVRKLKKRRQRCLSPSGFYSEGGGLGFHVSSDVPKAYNRSDKDRARQRFVKSRPVSIERSVEDISYRSIASLPDLSEEGWEKIMQRREEWSKPIYSVMLPVNKKNKMLRKSQPYDKKSMEEKIPPYVPDKSKKKLLYGPYAQPYKSFGKIDIKTDALEAAMMDNENDEEYEEEYMYDEELVENWVNKIQDVDTNLKSTDDRLSYAERISSSSIEADDFHDKNLWSSAKDNNVNHLFKQKNQKAKYNSKFLNDESIKAPFYSSEGKESIKNEKSKSTKNSDQLIIINDASITPNTLRIIDNKIISTNENIENIEFPSEINKPSKYKYNKNQINQNKKNYDDSKQSSNKPTSPSKSKIPRYDKPSASTVTVGVIKKDNLQKIIPENVVLADNSSSSEHEDFENPFRNYIQSPISNSSKLSQIIQKPDSKLLVKQNSPERNNEILPLKNINDDSKNLSKTENKKESMSKNHIKVEEQFNSDQITLSEKLLEKPNLPKSKISNENINNIDINKVDIQNIIDSSTKPLNLNNIAVDNTPSKYIDNYDKISTSKLPIAIQNNTSYNKANGKPNAKIDDNKNFYNKKNLDNNSMDHREDQIKDKINNDNIKSSYKYIEKKNFNTSIDDKITEKYNFNNNEDDYNNGFYNNDLSENSKYNIQKDSKEYLKNKNISKSKEDKKNLKKEVKDYLKNYSQDGYEPSSNEFENPGCIRIKEKPDKLSIENIVDAFKIDQAIKDEVWREAMNDQPLASSETIYDNDNYINYRDPKIPKLFNKHSDEKIQSDLETMIPIVDKKSKKKKSSIKKLNTDQPKIPNSNLDIEIPLFANNPNDANIPITDFNADNKIQKSNTSRETSLDIEVPLSENNKQTNKNEDIMPSNINFIEKNKGDKNILSEDNQKVVLSYDSQIDQVLEKNKSKNLKNANKKINSKLPDQHSNTNNNKLNLNKDRERDDDENLDESLTKNLNNESLTNINKTESNLKVDQLNENKKNNSFEIDRQTSLYGNIDSDEKLSNYDLNRKDKNKLDLIQQISKVDQDKDLKKQKMNKIVTKDYKFVPRDNNDIEGIIKNTIKADVLTDVINVQNINSDKNSIQNKFDLKNDKNIEDLNEQNKLISLEIINSKNKNDNNLDTIIPSRSTKKSEKNRDDSLTKNKNKQSSLNSINEQNNKLSNCDSYVEDNNVQNFKNISDTKEQLSKNLNNKQNTIITKENLDKQDKDTNEDKSYDLKYVKINKDIPQIKDKNKNKKDYKKDKNKDYLKNKNETMALEIINSENKHYNNLDNLIPSEFLIDVHKHKDKLLENLEESFSSNVSDSDDKDSDEYLMTTPLEGKSKQPSNSTQSFNESNKKFKESKEKNILKDDSKITYKDPKNSKGMDKFNKNISDSENLEDKVKKFKQNVAQHVVNPINKKKISLKDYMEMKGVVDMLDESDELLETNKFENEDIKVENDKLSDPEDLDKTKEDLKVILNEKVKKILANRNRSIGDESSEEDDNNDKNITQNVKNANSSKNKINKVKKPKIEYNDDDFLYILDDEPTNSDLANSKPNQKSDKIKDSLNLEIPLSIVDKSSKKNKNKSKNSTDKENQLILSSSNQKDPKQNRDSYMETSLDDFDPIQDSYNSKNKTNNVNKNTQINKLNSTNINNLDDSNNYPIKESTHESTKDKLSENNLNKLKNPVKDFIDVEDIEAAKFDRKQPGRNIYKGSSKKESSKPLSPDATNMSNNLKKIVETTNYDYEKVPNKAQINDEINNQSNNNQEQQQNLLDNNKNQNFVISNNKADDNFKNKDKLKKNFHGEKKGDIYYDNANLQINKNTDKNRLKDSNLDPNYKLPPVNLNSNRKQDSKSNEITPNNSNSLNENKLLVESINNQGPKLNEKIIESTTTTVTETDLLRNSRNKKNRWSKHRRSTSVDNSNQRKTEDTTLISTIPPSRTFEEAALEMLPVNHTEIWRKYWNSNRVVYTRGVYRPTPVYWRSKQGEPNANTSRYGQDGIDDTRISHPFAPGDSVWNESALNGSLDENHIPHLEDENPNMHEFIDGSFDNNGLEPNSQGLDGNPSKHDKHVRLNDSLHSDNRNNEDDYNGRYPYGEHDGFDSNNRVTYSQNFSPIIFNPVSRKVTLLRPIHKHGKKNVNTIYVSGTRSKSSDHIDKPFNYQGPIDFSKYGYISQMWMEKVDPESVEKSKTMYLTILPKAIQVPDHLKQKMKYQPTADDLSHWMIARGRTLRQMYRDQTSNLTHDEDHDVTTGMMSPNMFAGQQMIFFKIGERWPDLTWVLFDGVQTDSETRRTIADIKLKNDDVTQRVQDVLRRWWKLRGREATIEKLEIALNILELPYVFDEGNEKAPNFLESEPMSPPYIANKLELEETSARDPDVNRLLKELNRQTLSPENDGATVGRIRSSSAKFGHTSMSSLQRELSSTSNIRRTLNRSIEIAQ